MKILHVINSLAAGGAEKLVSDLASKQSEEDNVSLFTFNSKGDIFQEKLNENVHLYSQYKSSLFFFQKIRALFKLIKSNEIIHVHLFPSFYIVAYLSLFIPGKKYYFTEN